MCEQGLLPTDALCTCWYWHMLADVSQQWMTSFVKLFCYVTVLSSHQLLGLWSDPFPFHIPTKTLHTFLASPMHPTWPDPLMFLDLIILIIFGEKYKLWSSILCSFLQPPVTSSHFSPNILLSTLFSNTLSLCSSLNVSANYPYKITGKIIVLYSLIFTFLDIRQKTKDSELNSSKHCPNVIFLMNEILIC
jgi:hypothetical protein